MQSSRSSDEPKIERLDAFAYRVPTEVPESDGTLEWCATGVVTVEVSAGGRTGVGYTYSHPAAAQVVRTDLAECVVGCGALSPMAAYAGMLRAVRNIGSRGIAACAISAVDVALWDLKAKLLELPLFRLLGAIREEVLAYGSGGFTSYGEAELEARLGEWMQQGLRRVKMKVGREPSKDALRVRRARGAVGDGVALFVDANGAYSAKQALAMADAFSDHGVVWFEEPVSSDALEDMKMIRERGPSGMDIAAGEYGYNLVYFRRMLAAGAVDVLQADATRCFGCTGFTAVDALCRAYGVPLSAHTAPTLHAHLGCALPSVAHVEHFRDHVRIEQLFFDAPPPLRRGHLRPDATRPGLGIEIRYRDIEQFAV